MQPRSVFRKTLYERRHGLLWWSVGIALFGIAILSVWPSVRDEYQKLIQSYPTALLSIIGVDKAGLGSAAGYLQAELFSITLPLALIVYAIAGSSAVIAGEREAGVLEFLLVQPVSRRRVVLEKYLALSASLAIITGAFAAAIMIFAPVFDLHVGAWHLLAATVSAYLLGMLFGAVALLVSCCTNRRAVAAGVAAAAAFAAYLLSVLASLVSRLRGLRPLTPFWWYSGNNPLSHGIEPLHLGLLLGGTLLLLSAAVMMFDRQDIT